MKIREKSEEYVFARNMMKEEKANYRRGFWDAIIAALASVCGSLTLKFLVDDILIADRPQYLWPIQGIFIFFIFIQTAFHIRKGKVYAAASSNILNRIRKQMGRSVLGCEYYQLEGGKRGEVLTAFQYDIDGLDNYFANGLSEMVSSCITIVITLAFMLFLDWRLTLLTLPIFPILLLLFSKLQKYVEKKGTLLQEARKENTGLLNQMLDGMVLLRTFHLQQDYAERYGKSSEKMQKSNVDLSILYLIMNLASWSMIMVPYQAIMYGVAGTWYFKSGTPTIGLMLSFANYANSLIGPFLSVQQYQRNWTYAKVCLKDIEPILSLGQETEQSGTAGIEAVREYSYHIKNVSFGYHGEHRILKNKSLDFQENRISVIYGKSGTGKSTLLKLLLRMYPKEEGQIYLDRTEISEIDLEKYRSCIAYVPQDTMLLGGTVYENLQMADKTADRKEILQVLEALSMREEIEHLPGGLDTEVGEKGELLSGGQRQRILLAMAIIKKSKIIILDEPTSALDTENTYTLMNLLRKIKENHTIIMTSHDNITREYADAVYEFE